jgi:hypothetical protein
LFFFWQPLTDKIKTFGSSQPKEIAKTPVKASSKVKKGMPVGTVLDQYKGVKVYYNGSVKNVYGRNVTPDGYNLGLKYQCVEFVKRFYYKVYNHKMPDSYGHAKDFFNTKLPDGAFNAARGMRQFDNNNKVKPRKDDLVVIGASKVNPFGHLFIITEVGPNYIAFIQQNPGKGNPSRAQYGLSKNGDYWNIDALNILGWLRL